MRTSSLNQNMVRRKRKQRGGNFKGKKYQRSKKQEGGSFFSKLQKNPLSRKFLAAGKQLANGLLNGAGQPVQQPVQQPVKQPPRQKGMGMKKKQSGFKGAKLRNTIPPAKYVMYHQ